MTLMPGHLGEDQRKILRAVALAYRRVMRASAEPTLTRAEEAHLAQKRQSEALAAATAEYRRLNPFATGDKLAASGEVSLGSVTVFVLHGLGAQAKSGGRVADYAAKSLMLTHTAS